MSAILGRLSHPEMAFKRQTLERYALGASALGGHPPYLRSSNNRPGLGDSIFSFECCEPDHLNAESRRVPGNSRGRFPGAARLGGGEC